MISQQSESDSLAFSLVLPFFEANKIKLIVLAINDQPKSNSEIDFSYSYSQ